MIFVAHFCSFYKKILQFFETSGSQPRLIFTLVTLTSITFECEPQKIPACKWRRHYTLKMYNVMYWFSQRHGDFLTLARGSWRGFVPVSPRHGCSAWGTAHPTGLGLIACSEFSFGDDLNENCIYRVISNLVPIRSWPQYSPDLNPFIIYGDIWKTVCIKTVPTQLMD
jgi:hypothetical protein